MITTISEYDALERDANRQILPVAPKDDVTTALTAAGNVTVGASAEVIRVATDTAVHISIGSAATTSDAYIPAGAVEFFAVDGGDTVYIAVAV